ncbi:MAG: hypothetical protein P857_631 [Candidatus Xenolissoclinum pacificiensis L6]|uniref:Fungal lipase-type domain-containing protein n=1 Tax=Candidatus Xenolissoclinum pacificiensis L6 TaxID=1401685 RepID=W2UYY7_9RICK|nr:MAG: hypothetical protein P857_631 [Candidatus Xenolissoclinum pacificiensis L6]
MLSCTIFLPLTIICALTNILFPSFFPNIIRKSKILGNINAHNLSQIKSIHKDSNNITSLYNITSEKKEDIYYMLKHPENASDEIIILYIPGLSGQANQNKYHHDYKYSKMLSQKTCHPIAFLLGINNNHNGLYIPEYNNAYVQLFQDLQKRYSNKPIVILGHSLGGAVSTKVAKELLIHNNQTPIKLLLYNSYANIKYAYIELTYHIIMIPVHASIKQYRNNIRKQPWIIIFALPLLFLVPLIIVLEILSISIGFILISTINNKLHRFLDYDTRKNLQYIQDNFPNSNVQVISYNRTNDIFAKNNQPIQDIIENHPCIIHDLKPPSADISSTELHTMKHITPLINDSITKICNDPENIIPSTI